MRIAGNQRPIWQMPPVSRLAWPTLSGIGDIVIKLVLRLSEWPPVVAATADAAFVQAADAAAVARSGIFAKSHEHKGNCTWTCQKIIQYAWRICCLML